MTIEFVVNIGQSSRNPRIVLRRKSDGKYWSNNIGTPAWNTSPTFADKKITLTESAVADEVGLYRGTSAGNVGAADIEAVLHDDDDSADGPFVGFSPIEFSADSSGNAIYLSNVDVAKILGTTPTGFERSIRCIGYGTVTTGATTTSVPTSAMTPAGGVANQFAGRIIVFDKDTTTAGLRGAVGYITASSNAATPTFTIGSALPATPANGDTFCIL